MRYLENKDTPPQNQGTLFLLGSHALTRQTSIAAASRTFYPALELYCFTAGFTFLPGYARGGRHSVILTMSPSGRSQLCVVATAVVLSCACRSASGFVQPLRPAPHGALTTRCVLYAQVGCPWSKRGFEFLRRLYLPTRSMDVCTQKCFCF